MLNAVHINNIYYNVQFKLLVRYFYSSDIQ